MKLRAMFGLTVFATVCWIVMGFMVPAGANTGRVHVRYHPEVHVVAKGFTGSHYVAQCNMNFSRDGLAACSTKEWAEPVGDFDLPWTPLHGAVGRHGVCDVEDACYIGVFNVDQYGRPIPDGAVFDFIATP